MVKESSRKNIASIANFVVVVVVVVGWDKSLLNSCAVGTGRFGCDDETRLPAPRPRVVVVVVVSGGGP